MGSLNLDNTLEKGMTLSFGACTYIADGSGGFTSHLADPEDAELSHTEENCAQDNSAAQAAIMQNPPENIQEKENFDLIKRYWTDPESNVQTRVDNSNLLDGIDRMTNKLAECVNLAQSSLDKHGVPRISDPTITKPKNHHSSDISPM